MLLLVLAEGDRHGYEAAAEITERGCGEPDPAGLYHVLPDGRARPSVG